MGRVYIGIDNGASGSIGILYPDGRAMYTHVPTRQETDYQKTKTRIVSRLDRAQFQKIVCQALYQGDGSEKADAAIAVVERPFVNPRMFMASISAIRFFEATLICLEDLLLPYRVIDSKAWQKKLLPPAKGAELKKASFDVAHKLFPAVDFNGIKDGDGLLIAEYARQNNL